MAIPNAIRAIGAKPVAVDVDSLYKYHGKECFGAINDATVAVIAVNTFGQKLIGRTHGTIIP